MVKGAGNGNQGEKGYLYDAGSGQFLGNRSHDAPLSDAGLRQRALQKGGELTYTYTPPGLGGRADMTRMASWTATKRTPGTRRRIVRCQRVQRVEPP